MTYLFPFILGVIFVTINGLTMLAFAQTQGFKLKPSSIGLGVAAAGTLAFGLVTPITGQSAMIAVAGKQPDIKQRVASLLIAAATMVVLGITGAVSGAIDFVGPTIIAGMMAGVGLMLMKVGIGFVADKQKGNLQVGLVSVLSAFAAHFFFFGNPNSLVYVLAVSVGASTIYYLIFQKKKRDTGMNVTEGQTDGGKFWTKEYWKTDDWKLVKPSFTIKAIIGALALICLGAGMTVSFGTINANVAGIPQNLDHLTLLSGLAGFASVMFGGMPLETIIAGTAGAPWPIIGAFAVLVVCVIMLLLGLVNKLCKYMPAQSIAGFLLIIGFFSTFMLQIRGEPFSADLPMSGTAMAVTALTDNPFYGVCAGLLVRVLGHMIGLV